jgi:predicted nuclease of predicted toxin-antitoxin system
MKFLCDVRISIKLAKHINNQGFECIHINTILDKWFTSDSTIAKFSDLNDLILITKDFDFKSSFLVHKTPKKLIKINLGNISNTQLIEMFNQFITEIETINNNHNQYMIEIDSHFIKVTSNQ